MNSSAIVTRLLAWFAHNARDLPWRRTRDPYAIWVSEIMLQQTQVNTVIPYWERWMRALPDVRILAKASPALLHKLWEGLGYYSRARNLHQAARILVDQHGGRLPRTLEEWLALPGIGRYTAGAICSLAFDQPKPIVDGNVARVLARLFAIPGSPRQPATNAEMWRLAAALVRYADRTRRSPPSARKLRRRGWGTRPCSGLNQALMELGATVCTPRQPRCELCPVASNCRALSQGRVADFPTRVARPKPTPRAFLVMVAEQEGRFLARQRPTGVVNAHLWEFPNVELATSSSNSRRARVSLFGSTSAKLRPLCVVRHTITRYRIKLHTYHVSGANLPDTLATNGQWLTLQQMRRRAFAGGHKRILQHLASPMNGPRVALSRRLRQKAQ